MTTNAAVRLSTMRRLDIVAERGRIKRMQRTWQREILDARRRHRAEQEERARRNAALVAMVSPVLRRIAEIEGMPAERPATPPLH